MVTIVISIIGVEQQTQHDKWLGLSPSKGRGGGFRGGNSDPQWLLSDSNKPMHTFFFCGFKLYTMIRAAGNFPLTCTFHNHSFITLI